MLNLKNYCFLATTYSVSAFCFLLFLGFDKKAQGFSLLEGIPLNDTERWDRNQVRNRGLAGSLQWNVETNFLNNLNFAEGNITNKQLITAITNAFDVWENAAKNDAKISDLVKFSQGGTAVEAYPSDGSGVDFSKVLQGTEISLFSRTQNSTIVKQADQPEDIFTILNGEREIGKTIITSLLNRKPISTATNKSHNVGATIVDADIYVNSSENWTLQPNIHANAQDFVAVMIHEIGHSLGLGHPDKDLYFDTNNDPNDRMNIDPLQPELSPNLMSRNNPQRNAFNPLAVMIPDAAVKQLVNDDLSGFNYLYPECPQPTSNPSPQSQFELQQTDTSIGCLDYGDAPDSYQTLLSSNGPSYQEGELQLLGNLWDGEPDGKPTSLADGDDKSGGCGINICFPPDDEDGVIFGDSWVDVIFNITRPDPNPYQLRAWWDLNENGIFDHTSELIIDDLLTLDAEMLTKRYNLGFDPTDYYSRFRLTWDPKGDQDVKPFGEFFSTDCSDTDEAAGNCISHGEVEDYAPVPEPSSILGLFALGSLGLTQLRKKHQ